MPLSQTAEDLTEYGKYTSQERKLRGYTVYNFTQLQAMSGWRKDGKLTTVQVERPYFELSVDERIDIFRKCDIVFGVITSRMNRISSTPYNIVLKRKIEDRLVSVLRAMKELYDEYIKCDFPNYRALALIIRKKITNELPGCLPDLTNFDRSLVRYHKLLNTKNENRSEEIRDWLQNPNINDTWEEWVKKYVFDMMIHGAQATYKEMTNEKLSNFYILPGGTVLPIRSKYVGGTVDGFIQLTANLEVQVFYGDEVSFADYVPTSARAYGYLPLEALVNKVAETLLFDQLMAMQADGTKPPEKVVVFGEKSPFGDGSAEFDLNVPMDGDKQKRIETELNEPRKHAIRSLTGTGTPTILDLSRENTMSIQSQRQKDIRESVALVYNMSNMEVNLTGSGDTSGRSTSEEQGKIDYTKGVYPLMSTIMRTINDSILPYRYGNNYIMEFESGSSEKAELELQRLMLDVGYSINELREIRQQAKFDDPNYDKPGRGASSPAGGEDINPLFMKNVE